MLTLTIFSEFLLYLCFSLLMGGLLFLLVPPEKKPRVVISKRLLLICTALIPILSFLPVLYIGVILLEDMDFWIGFTSILLTFEIGKAWMFTFFISLFLFILLLRNPFRNKSYTQRIGLFLLLILIFAFGKAGHAASITEWSGFILHSIHFLAVIVWAGPLLIVSWKAKETANWSGFLKWFSPLSVVCMGTLLLAGFFTMQIDINSYDDPQASLLTEYLNGWVVPYGQALLMKHLVIVPLLVFAFLNGYLLRRKAQKDPSFNPLPWVKAESVFILMLFALTAYMGQQYPPHEIALLIKTEEISPLFTLFYPGNISPDLQILINWQPISYQLMAVGLLFLMIALISAVKKGPVLLSFISTLLFVASSYISLMLTMQ